MNVLPDLFLTFAKIGLFTFGGGYAMIALIENTCVEKKQWITHDEMMNITVIAESTPGPIAINCATYVGYKKAGLCGALTATLGMILPSFCINFAISQLQKMPKKPMPGMFMLCAFAAMLLINIFSLRISSIILMLTAGLISLIIFMVRKPAAGGTGE